MSKLKYDFYKKRKFWQQKMWLAEDNKDWDFYKVCKAEFDKFDRLYVGK